MRQLAPLSAAIAAAVAAMLPLAAAAHNSWLLPNAMLVTSKDGIVSVDGSFSEDLFVFERALKLEKLRVSGPAGTQVQPSAVVAARNHETVDLTLPKPGTYRISNVSRAVMGSYKLDGETKRLRSTPETLSKDLPAGAEVLGIAQNNNRQQTFVSREEPGQIAFAPEGDGLEFLPLDAVTDLSAGDASHFRLLLDGKPVADTAVTIKRGGNRYRYKAGETMVKTDAKGEFTMTWTEPGLYWLGANVGDRPAQGGAAGGPVGGAGGQGGGMTGGTVDKPLLRNSVNATFEVLPK